MMDWNQQLKLQAYLDGELSDSERQEVESLLQEDKEASALIAELRETNRAVSVFAEETRLPESRDFYWSKIRRDIEQLEQQTESEQEPKPVFSWLLILRKALVPVTAVAVVLFAGLVLTRQESLPGSETSLADSGAFTYHDFANGATLVWLTYPADNDLTEDEATMFE